MEGASSRLPWLCPGVAVFPRDGQGAAGHITMKGAIFQAAERGGVARAAVGFLQVVVAGGLQFPGSR
jgi:hypothetical protein